MSVLTEPVPEIDLEVWPTLPSEPFEKRETLLAAADLIQKRGWTVLSYRDRHGYCMRGAWHEVVGLLDTDVSGRGSVHMSTQRLDEEERHFGVWPYRVAEWNNSLPSDSRSERIHSSWLVVRALRLVADGATWKEATS